MHKEILSKEQVELLPVLQMFGKQFGLVGGTAIALHIGHRRSIDFDLFSEKSFKNEILEEGMRKLAKVDRVIVDKKGEFTLMSSGVKMTFFQYVFPIRYGNSLNSIIKMPDLLTLAAMKAYALGRRAKWKDYVDLYFVIKNYYPITDIAIKGDEIFGKEFNEKLLRVQLSYFDDINYQEEIEFLPGFEVDDKAIKKELVELSLR